MSKQETNPDRLQDRLLDVRLLWDNGHKNGAFIMALIALAGASRRRYPKHTPRSVYFDKLREFHPDQTAQIVIEEDRDKREGTKPKKAKSKKPRLFYDAMAFKCMLLDLLGDILLPHPKPGVHQPKTNFTLPLGEDRRINIEDLFYKVLRNTAIHEGTFASVAFLTKRTPEGDVLRLTDPPGIPEWWIIHLIEALRVTPELAASS